MALAVTEAVTNAAEHAYPPGGSGTVRLQVRIDDDGYMDARVSDQGTWRIPDPAQTERGRGLMLARQPADELTVTHPAQDASAPQGARGTTVTLRYRLHCPATLATRAPALSGALSGAGETVPLTAELVAAQPVPCLRLAGPADNTTADRLAGQLLTASRGGTLPLTADLTGLTILASAGIRALQVVSDQLTAHHQKFTLIAAPGSPAASVLDLVRLPHRPSPAGAPVDRR